MSPRQHLAFSNPEVPGGNGGSDDGDCADVRGPVSRQPEPARVVRRAAAHLVDYATRNDDFVT